MGSVTALLCTIVYLVLLLIIATVPRNRLQLVFSFLIGTLFVWSAASWVATAVMPDRLEPWVMVVAATTLMACSAFYHLATIISDRPANLTIIASYLATAVGIGLVLVASPVTEITFTPGHLGIALNYRLTVWALPAAIVVLPWSALALYYLAKGYASSKEDQVKRRLSLALAGGVFYFASGLTQLYPPWGGSEVSLWLHLAGSVFLTFAIYRLDLLRDRIFKKALAYLLRTSILTAVLFTAIMGVQSLPDTSARAATITLLVMLAFFLSAILGFIRDVTLYGVERIFFPHDYFYRRAWQRFSHQATSIVDLSVLAPSLLNNLVSAMRLEAAHLYLVRKQVDLAPHLDLPSVTFVDPGHEMVKAVRAGQARGHSPAALSNGYWLGDGLVRWEGKLLFPLWMGRELIGVLDIGNKKSGATFSYGELEMLRNFCQNAAIALGNAILLAEMRLEASLDFLTGLYNHRYFQEALREGVAHARQHNYPVALLLLDIDLFKLYNDVHGHSLGDEALIRLSSLITQLVSRESYPRACLARHGGEEFAIMLPQVDKLSAIGLAEDIREHIQKAFMSEGLVPMLTVSIGVAAYPQDAQSARTLLEAAESALDLAKAKGRNRVQAFRPDSENGNGPAADAASPSAEVAAADGASAHTETKRLRRQVHRAYLATIYALAATIEAKDEYTYGHSRRVAEYVGSLAKALNLPESKRNNLVIAGMLHDLGKIGVPEHILKKPGPLTSEEIAVVRSHVELSVTILRNVPELAGTLAAIQFHHEHYQGTGYPLGLKGEEIPLEGRIMAVADAFEAMTSNRPYRKAMSIEEACLELQRCAGTQFDPKLVQVFIENVIRPSGKLAARAASGPASPRSASGPGGEAVSRMNTARPSHQYPDACCQ